MHKKQSMIDKIFRSLAFFGLSQFLGIPLVGKLVSELLDIIAGTATVASDVVVAYSESDDVYAIMQEQLRRGATVTSAEVNEFGEMEVKYDVATYSGDDINADGIDLLGELF